MKGNPFTIEKVREIIKGYGCELISTVYINAKQELQIRCSCGSEFTSTLDKFINRKFHCCRKCVKNLQEYPTKLSYESLNEYVQNSGSKLITIKSEYENVHTYIDIQCSCGNIYNSQAFAFRASKTKTCPKCSEVRALNKRRYNNDEIINIINEINIKNSTTYQWIYGEYKDVNSDLFLIDDEGYRYKTMFHNLYKKPILSKFHPKNPFTLENIKIWISKNMVGYEIISTRYVSATDKLLFKCPNGHEFAMWFSNIQSGQRCPHCDITLGEEYTRNSLLSNSLSFEFQYSFDDCRGKKRPLLFDFAVFKDADKTQLWFLIEYDGELHYQVNRFTDDIHKRNEKLRQQQEYDKVKDVYCSNNNIFLLRIPYWEKYNISTIINEYIALINYKQCTSL